MLGILVETMKEGFWKIVVGLGVSFLLVFLISSILVSASGVKLSTGTPSESKVFVGETVFFHDVSFMIRKAEVIPVDYLVFAIFNQSDDEEVASVHFSLIGDELSGSHPINVFTVDTVTDTSNLPYQNGGGGYGYGYGYGYGSMDLTIIYTISYMTHLPGKFYSKLFIYSVAQLYDSGKSKPFIVLQAPASPITISVDIVPGVWPNHINQRGHGILFVAICGKASFNVSTIDPKMIRLSSVDSGKKRVKPLPLCWGYIDIATPWLGSDGDGHDAHGDGSQDLLLLFRYPSGVYVLKLFKYPGEILRLTITGTLKSTANSCPVEGHDYVQLDDNGKHKKS